ncbi:putative receptor protein kinase CRINKLY4 [Selaginella moellendorffii]|uniref:putative receptor protein kinase CRINKLY4 n=1 Tax=Selaginella moellendorffii TaxID=88036 RepID=UPI000D1D00AB|nr:putative receptor protein kinase CRINKLY4 [Selaginella moellendorffii]|eukprot:XP_024537943.1 putative receptor protein kinase CRINKLY4 [Selaginella moellendorffii]
MGTLAPMWGQFDPTQDSSTKGTYHMCVIEAGSLLPHCLGNMSRNSSVTLVDPPKDTPFLALSAGAQFTCGLIYGSQVPLCWGDLDNNKLAVPEKLQKVSYSTIASGAYHVCALRSGAAAAVDCWGGKSNGESQPPVNGGPYVSLTSGWDFSCALTALGRAVCWGALTNRTFTHNHAEPNTSFDAIFAGRSYVCGVERQTGNATCWGDNSYSQSNVPPYTRFKTIAPSMFHTCGLIRDTGVADCWGDDFYSQVNATSLGVTFSTLAAGDFYTCGVNAEDLAVRCWGNGVQGTKDFARVKVAPTVCRAARCSKHQYQLPSSFCPGMGNYKACVDCTPGLCGKRKNVITLAVLCVVLVLTVVLVAAGFTILEFRRKKLAKAVLADQEPDLELLEYEKQAKRVKEYTQQELSLATGNFSSDMVIGKGAFGMVYKARLPSGEILAIKKGKLGKAASFGGELKLLSRLHHTNLVNLIGYCKQEKQLVFEFMANGSLYDCLFVKNIKLDWSTRLKIAIQAAHGLEYLHLFADPSIIHRDVKSSNILLDEGFNAHVADFGASTLGPTENSTHVTSTSLVGTPGYVDPEYFQTMQLSPKSDVYSFGVVILELFTGRKAVDLGQSIVGVVAWVEKVASEFSSLVPALDMEPPVDEEKSRILAEVLELGVCCVRPKAIDRPTMTVVASSLEKVLKHFGNPSSAREWISSPWTETTSGPSTVDGPSTLEASFSSSFLAEIRLVSPK